MTLHVTVCGAGFGGLELSTILSDALGDDLDLVLIDRSDSFYFGYSKMDVMFGRELPVSVHVPYRLIDKPGVRFVQETITRIDADNRRVTTDRGVYNGDFLVIALGADVDPAATPGLVEGGNEFYTMAGAEKLRDVLPNFSKGRAIIGAAAAPFKCPPAPSEAAFLLDDYLTQRGVRQDCEIALVLPFPVPVPPSPATSEVLLATFAKRGIQFVANHSVRALDPSRQAVILDDGSEMLYDLFLGIPKHKAPEVVVSSGLVENGWIPVNPRNLATKYAGVYAIGDVASAGTAKAGAFAESAAQVVAADILAKAQGSEPPAPYTGGGSCYVEFGGGKVGRIDVEFLPGPKPVSSFNEGSITLAEDKRNFGSKRRARWFGLG